MSACLRFRFAFAALLSTIGVLAAAAAPSQQPQPPRWAVDAGTHYCTLARTGMGGVPVTFGLQVVPGSESLQLALVGRSWAADAFSTGDKLELVLSPPGTRLESTARVETLREGDRVLVLRMEKQEILEPLEQAKELLVVRDGETRLRLPVPPARNAVGVLRHCIDGMLDTWGVDPKVHAALRQPPRTDEKRPWITDSDYPGAAIDKGASGMTVARVDVSAEGRVLECKVVASSGSRDLDSKTCVKARSARLEPAIGPDGRATAARTIMAVRWLLPK